jgi:hypothetical protein
MKGCRLQGWMGIKNSIVIAHRFEDQIQQNIKLDLERLGFLLAALPMYSKALLNCTPHSIIYFNNIKKGKGISLKYGWYKDYLSITLGDVSSKERRKGGEYCDFINLKDPRPVELMKTFYEKVGERLDNWNGGDIQRFESAVKKGKFEKKFNNLCEVSYEGKEKYVSRLLTIYSYVNKRDKVEYFADDEFGIDAIDYNFPQDDLSKEEARDYLFKLIKTIRNLHAGLYYRRKKAPKTGISFLTMTNNTDVYQIIEYKKRSKNNKENQDVLGALLQLREAEYEEAVELKEIIRNSFEYLDGVFEKYKKKWEKETNKWVKKEF